MHLAGKVYRWIDVGGRLSLAKKDLPFETTSTDREEHDHHDDH